MDDIHALHTISCSAKYFSVKGYVSSCSTSTIPKMERKFLEEVNKFGEDGMLERLWTGRIEVVL